MLFSFLFFYFSLMYICERKIYILFVELNKGGSLLCMHVTTIESWIWLSIWAMNCRPALNWLPMRKREGLAFTNQHHQIGTRWRCGWGTDGTHLPHPWKLDMIWHITYHALCGCMVFRWSVGCEVMAKSFLFFFCLSYSLKFVVKFLNRLFSKSWIWEMMLKKIRLEGFFSLSIK